LAYIENNNADISLRLYFDKMPDTDERCSQFKGHLHALQETKHLSGTKIHIAQEDITEVKSHDHVLLQCLDVVLGSMAFRLNEKHKDKPDGSRVRGKRTVAKEKLYKYILAEICKLAGNFNIGISTGTRGDLSSLWKDSYRHWQFTARNATFNENKTKRGKNKEPR